MTQETKDYVIAEVNKLKETQSCCQELKDECDKWLAAVDTDEEAAESAALIAEIEEDIGELDHIIMVFGSDMAKERLGEERANQMVEHAKERKAAGEKYCDCPACTVCAEILEVKDDILA